MRRLALLSASALAAALCVPAEARATNAGPSLPNGAVGATFRFNTAVKTPKGSQSASGTIAVRSTGPGKLTLTVATSDGSTRTIPLVIANGTVKPAQAPAPDENPEAQAAAKALLANMKLAASVGMAARKSSGKSFTVPVTLTPVGEGIALPADLSMMAYVTGHGATRFAGEVEQSTSTQLAASGGINPAQLEKSVGVGVASSAAGLTPAGRAAAMVAMHHRNAEQQAANGALPDTISLSVEAHFANGKFRDISGQQTDALSVGGKAVSIVSSWSFVSTSK